MFCSLQSWKFVSGLSQDGNSIHSINTTLDIIIDTRFHRDMLNTNTNTMQDIEGQMKYLWPLKKFNWEMASNILKITIIIRKHIPHKIDLTCNNCIK